MDFTVEELKALKEQKQIRDEAERTYHHAKLVIEDIEKTAHFREVANRIRNFVPGFLPPFRVENTRIRFLVSGGWWNFPMYATFCIIPISNEYRVYVYRPDDDGSRRYGICFLQHGYEIWDKGFNPPLELIALGIHLMNAYYLKQEFVYHGYAHQKINNPLFSL